MQYHVFRTIRYSLILILFFFSPNTFSQQLTSAEQDSFDRIIRLLFDARGEVVYGRVPWVSSLPLGENVNVLVTVTPPRGSRASSYALIEIPIAKNSDVYDDFLKGFLDEDYLLFNMLDAERNFAHQHFRLGDNGKWSVYDGGRGSIVEPDGVWTFKGFRSRSPEIGSFCRVDSEESVDLIGIEKLGGSLDTHGPDPSMVADRIYIKISVYGRSMLPLTICSQWIERTIRTFGEAK